MRGGKKETNIINPAQSKILLTSAKNGKQEKKSKEIVQRNFPELKSF